MTSLFGRVAWIVFLGVVAVAAVGLQMDREGRRNFAVAQAVPAPFRSSSLESLAHAA
jgi:hypothetical protein